MNVSHQFQQVGIFLAQNGFVTILKQMAAAPVAPIVCRGMTGQQSAHDGRHGRITGTKQQMEMVRDQRPGKTACLRLRDNGFQAFKELVTIMIVIEDITATDSASNYMVQSARSIDSGLAWHGLVILKSWEFIKFK
ncbi:hypothetical protein DSCA_27790 [Desulfosarcina alkanivorans]|uniref:Uncharacterized protein n=1 Tax=Desulfosarcina alkanivorans TaxID=571177 RepID=A0A5K7YLY3_9BACT|nr:hypothetical protein DSCA_27790 [Desulfosarcina alkanivorans]